MQFLYKKKQEALSKRISLSIKKLSRRLKQIVGTTFSNRQDELKNT